MLEHLLPFPRFTFLRLFIVITHPWSILWSGILAIKVCYHRPLMQARVFNESFTGFCFLINKPVMQRKIMKFASPANLLQYFCSDNIYFNSFHFGPNMIRVYIQKHWWWAWRRPRRSNQSLLPPFYTLAAALPDPDSPLSCETQDPRQRHPSPILLLIHVLEIFSIFP